MSCLCCLNKSQHDPRRQKAIIWPSLSCLSGRDAGRAADSLLWKESRAGEPAVLRSRPCASKELRWQCKRLAVVGGAWAGHAHLCSLLPRFLDIPSTKTYTAKAVTAIPSPGKAPRHCVRLVSMG